MILTLINWLYILVTSYVTGSFILRRVLRKADPSVSLAGSRIACGIVVLTAYAGYASLFAGVGLAANIIMLLACAVFFVTLL